MMYGNATATAAAADVRRKKLRRLIVPRCACVVDSESCAMPYPFIVLPEALLHPTLAPKANLLYP